ncbi:hypothetical protein KKA85_04785 [bacterium]|nr:hypothetical protein [bacterium]MBU1675078.1 hypothetical protein [bacterium]
MTQFVDGLRRPGAAAWLVLLLVAGCGGSGGPVQIASFPLDDAEGLLGVGENVGIDAGQSVDGGGSLHVFSNGKTLVNLHEFTPGRIEGDDLILSADMKSEMLGGDTFLDLWIFTADAAPRWIRRLCKDIGRTKDWQAVEVRMPLLPGEAPQKMRTAVYLEGKGHLWIDDLRIIAVHAQDAAAQE